MVQCRVQYELQFCISKVPSKFKKKDLKKAYLIPLVDTGYIVFPTLHPLYNNTDFLLQVSSSSLNPRIHRWQLARNTNHDSGLNDWILRILIIILLLPWWWCYATVAMWLVDFKTWLIQTKCTRTTTINATKICK